MVFEVVQRRRVEALDLRFSASHQIIRSHVPILQPARCLSCCVLFRVRSSMRWRIHQKGSMFWTRHLALNFAFGFFPQRPAAGHKLQHKLLRQPRSPQTFSHRAPGLEFKSYNPAVFEKSTHQDAPWGWKNPHKNQSRSSWAECFTHCVDCCVLVACCYVVPPESERHRWATV